jgi:thiol-disulfide isomerase/thioredoxin
MMKRLCILLLLTGCFSPAAADIPTDPPPSPELRDPTPSPESSSGVGVTFGVPSAGWDLVQAAGDGFSITLNSEFVYAVGDAELRVPPKTTANLALDGASAVVSFDGGTPTATQRIARIPVKASVKSLTLFEDGAGLAKTNLGTWKFQWQPITQSAASKSEDPADVVVLYTANGDWCAPCRAERGKNPAEKLKALGKSLRVIETDGKSQVFEYAGEPWNISAGVPKYVFIGKDGKPLQTETLEAVIYNLR